jgi:uncharacterized protein (TIGR01244 family)
MLRLLDEKTATCGQITPGQVAELKAQGFTMLINNRPDGEDPDQPVAGDIEEAAARAGIAYRFVPIIRGIGPGDVEAMQSALEEAGEGKVLAFCRSGNRSSLVWALARRRQGVSREEVEQQLVDAGIDPMPIAHLL